MNPVSNNTLCAVIKCTDKTMQLLNIQPKEFYDKYKDYTVRLLVIPKALPNDVQIKIDDEQKVIHLKFEQQQKSENTNFYTFTVQEMRESYNANVSI